MALIRGLIVWIINKLPDCETPIECRMRECHVCRHYRTIGNRGWCDMIGLSNPETYAGTCPYFEKE